MKGGDVNMYEIEKGMDIKKGKIGIYPFEGMEVNDSFFVPFTEGTTLVSIQACICSRMNIFSKKHGTKFATRICRKSKGWDEEGVRCWRVE